uniref:HTA909 n=1 Tax=Arundo donax TaxID=35708 RepID=A0A0A9EDU2_ARUDO
MGFTSAARYSRTAER